MIFMLVIESCLTTNRQEEENPLLLEKLLWLPQPLPWENKLVCT